MDEQQAPKKVVGRKRLSEAEKVELARKRAERKKQRPQAMPHPTQPSEDSEKKRFSGSPKKPKRKRKGIGLLSWVLIAVILITGASIGYIFMNDAKAENAIQENGQTLLKDYNPKDYKDNSKISATANDKNSKDKNSDSTDGSKNGKGGTVTNDVTSNGTDPYGDGDQVLYDTPIKNLTVDDIDLEKQKQATKKVTGFVRGRIQAEAIALDLPLFDGFSEDKLLVGAGTLKSNQSLNGNKNFGVAGHNTHTWRNVLFAQVPKLEKGNIVTVSYHNVVAKYRVTSKTIIAPTEVDKIQDDVAEKAKKPLLSIITCTDDAKNRYLIRGEQISKVSYE